MAWHAATPDATEAGPARSEVSVEPCAAASSHRSASAIRPTSCRVDALTRDSRGSPVTVSGGRGVMDRLGGVAMLSVPGARPAMQRALMRGFGQRELVAQ